MEALTNATIKGIKALQTEVDSLAGMLMQHKLALYYLLSKEGGLCFWLNTTCCHYINKSGEIETDIKKLHELSAEVRKSYSPAGESWWDLLTRWLPNHQWLKILFMNIILLIAIILVSCCMVQLTFAYCSSITTKKVAAVSTIMKDYDF